MLFFNVQVANKPFIKMSGSGSYSTGCLWRVPNQLIVYTCPQATFTHLSNRKTQGGGEGKYYSVIIFWIFCLQVKTFVARHIRIQLSFTNEHCTKNWIYSCLQVWQLCKHTFAAITKVVNATFTTPMIANVAFTMFAIGASMHLPHICLIFITLANTRKYNFSCSGKAENR